MAGARRPHCVHAQPERPRRRRARLLFALFCRRKKDASGRLRRTDLRSAHFLQKKSAATRRLPPRMILPCAPKSRAGGEPREGRAWGKGESPRALQAGKSLAPAGAGGQKAEDSPARAGGLRLSLPAENARGRSPCAGRSLPGREITDGRGKVHGSEKTASPLAPGGGHVARGCAAAKISAGTLRPAGQGPESRTAPFLSAKKIPAGKSDGEKVTEAGRR